MIESARNVECKSATELPISSTDASRKSTADAQNFGFVFNRIAATVERRTRFWWPCAFAFFLFLNSTPTTAADDRPPSNAHIVAPNTAARAFEQAGPAVVKLYGRGIGREHGYGTGTLVSADGRIVTVLSLLSSRSGVRVVLADGRTFEATVERKDEFRQLALLKIDATDLPFVAMADTSALALGDTVFAMGNWFKIAEGREPVSINRGVFSIRSRLDARRLTQDYEYEGDVLIFDAMTSNPGAPGGPLLDVEGNGLGIIGRVVEASATNTRINYALPAEEIRAFLGGEATSAPAKETRDAPKAEPDIGISISRLGFRHVSPYVERVRINSPAAKAGIRVDDLVLSIGNDRLRNATDYHDVVARLVPGEKVRFVVKRGDQVLTVMIEVGAKE